MCFPSCKPVITIVIASLVVRSGVMPAQAAEVDQFTRRFDHPPADSSVEINRRFNEFLQIAVDEANDFERRRWGRGDQKMRERRLYKEITRTEVANFFRPRADPAPKAKAR